MKKLIILSLLLVASISIKAQLYVTFANQVDPCNHDGSVDAVPHSGTAPYTYRWYKEHPNQVLVGTNSTLTNAVGGQYRVDVTDANGLTVQAWVFLSPRFTVGFVNSTDPICPLDNGTLSCGIFGNTYPYIPDAHPYIYRLSTGQTIISQTGNGVTFSNLSSGIYHVFVTDSNGCVFDSRDTVAILRDVAQFNVQTTTTPSNCNDGTASAIVTGTVVAPLSYYWSTTPPQTTQTVVNLIPNTAIKLTVTDATGCSGYDWPTPIAYGLNALRVTAIVNNTICPNSNGSIMLSVSGGTPPYTYVWSTGATTQNIFGLAEGEYSVTVTDAAGCSFTIVKIVHKVANISATFSTTPINCLNAGGTATIIPSGGMPPYTYLWSNGQTTATANNLSSGHYGVTISDSSGCSRYFYGGYLSIPAYCYETVRGNVINDINGNCLIDASETGLPWQVINLGNGSYISTDVYGKYIVNTQAATTYTISHTPSSSNWNLICPTNNYTVTTGQSNGESDFYDQPTSIQDDISVEIYGGLARPGFSYMKHCTITNNGTTAVSGTVALKYDSLETFLGGGENVLSHDVTNHLITFSYTNIPPFAQSLNYLLFSISSDSAMLGQLLTTSVIANPIAGDLTPNNNYDTSIVTVVGSYDPNDKAVTPKGIGASGLIPASNTPFDYTIRFQNTGTYYAQTVAITDTLDADLDVTTFKLLGASHNVTWKLEGPRVLIFTFNNIYLPDSLTNEPGSHGYVSYRINQLPNLAAGTEIKNTAYIYFDYNLPIVTNTTLNTIQQVGIKESQYMHGISIKPNPAQDKISIVNKTNELCTKVELLDINGRVVYAATPQGTTVQLPDLAAGLYIVSAHYNSGVYKEKLVISK